MNKNVLRNILNIYAGQVHCFGNMLGTNYLTFFSELSASGSIVEWGECLPDCPQEVVSSVCIMEPGTNFILINQIQFTLFFILL